MTGTTGNPKYTTGMIRQGSQLAFPSLRRLTLHHALLERSTAMIRYASANLHFSDAEKRPVTSVDDPSPDE
jgi:hypothetical protein